MNYNTLHVEIDADSVAYVALNRPEKRNAMNAELLDELADLARRLSAMDDIRAVILSGRGDVFCAGGDLDWMRAQMGAHRKTRMREARRLAEGLRALNEMSKPLILRIHGAAFGGGVGLACIADVTIAARDAKFGLTETRLGLIPATIGPYVITRMGEGPARQVFMSSRVFDASEAMRLGIASQVCEVSMLDAAVQSEVAPYLTTAPGAVAAAKALARSLGPRIDDDVITATITHLADRWETDEARAGIEAFFNKQPPPWSKP